MECIALLRGTEPWLPPNRNIVCRELFNWKILNPPLDQVHRLKKEFSSSEIFARAVANRCIKSLIQSRSFFSPSLTEFQNSYLMKDIGITIVIEENE